MRVDLKRDFFGPDAKRYRRGVAEVPEEFRDQLPSDAEVVEDDRPLRRATEGRTGGKPNLPKATVKAGGKAHVEDVTKPKEAAREQTPIAPVPKTAGGAVIPAQIKTSTQDPHDPDAEESDELARAAVKAPPKK